MWNKIYFYIRYLYLFIRYILFERDITRLKINTNKDIIILWNGPSFKESIIKHADFFKDKYILAVSSFVKTDYFNQLKPKFYIISDSGFWEEEISYKNDDKNISINKNRLKNIRKEFLENMINKVKWDMNLFLPLQSKWAENVKKLIEKNKYIKISYYVMNPINFRNKFLRHFLYKHNFGMPTAQTVIIPAILIALNINFKKIYLIWWDHSWHEDYYVDEKNILYTKDRHFYGSKLGLIPLMSNGKDHDKLHEEWLSLHKAFKWHILLEEYAKSLGAKIYNASEKSYIDAYERYRFLNN